MEAEQYSSALGAHDDDDEEAFVRGMTGQHHGAPDGSNTYAHADYGQNIDPTLNGHAHVQRNSHHAQSSQMHHQHQRQPQVQQSQHHQDPTNHYADAQMQRQFYGAPGGAYTMHTPSENMSEPSPGQFTSVSPVPQRLAPAFTPQDRTLPSKDVTDDTIDDAYVQFILYCNPSVPLDTDTTELRKVFRQPPKSDGKTFNVFHLMELIEKFENKEVKTWTKLAIELGVERTETSSAQKVQQYAVRLKRWMHAMHVDAFFEYMLGKPHNYYQQIPPIGEERQRIRDGVPIEEDLALRALHPETRPKRGRRKTDDKEDSSEKDQPPSKRQHLDTGTPVGEMEHFVYPDSAIPSSAGGIDRYLEEAVSHEQWTAATQSVLSAHPASASTPTAGGQQFRWRAFSKLDTATTPQSAHPSSGLLMAHTPTTPHPDDLPTPTTATTPSSAKTLRRRRHGPAVSSAWSGSSNPLTGKLRGRPPQNRSTRDGPFSMFPAKATPLDTVASTPTPTPIISHPTRSFNSPNAGFRQGPPNLHLQVPQQVHRPISMASPAPNSAIEPHTNGLGHVPNWPTHSPHPASASVLQPQSTVHLLGKRDFSQIRQPAPTMEQMERSLVVALMQANVPRHQHHVNSLGRSPMSAFSGGVEEAKRIAGKLFSQLKNYSGAEERLAMMMGYHPSAGIDVDEDSGVAFQGLTVERIRPEVTRTLEEFGLGDPDDDGHNDNDDDDDDDDDDNDDTNVIGDDDTIGVGSSRRGTRRRRRRRREKRYRLIWEAGVGPLKAKVACTVVLSPDPASRTEQTQYSTTLEGGLESVFGTGNDNGGEDMESLKKKIKMLQQQLRGKNSEVRRVRESVLRAIAETSGANTL